MTSEQKALLEAASELGARRALARLGLADEAARDDVNELRGLLAAWRDAKASARKEVVNWIIRALFAALLIGIAVKLNLTDLVRG